jgi:acetolactate synthase-1/2/3 large subunit
MTTAENDTRNDSDRVSITVAEHIVMLLSELGVREAYGVCGREIVPVWTALLASRGTPYEITTRHARHENGAGFAAIGSWAQSDRPVAVYTTTGPGLTNAITALETARATGAKLVLISPLTPAAERGRLGIQATGPAGYANPDLYATGRIFDFVAMLESPEQLATLAGPLASGFAGGGGFMAHIAIPTAMQTVMTDLAPVVPAHRRPAPGMTPAMADELVELLRHEPFAVWVGWGARHHAPAVRRLLDATSAPAICSPRGLGIADRHPAFLGATGNGGRESIHQELAACCPRRTLVLGSALGEATSGWHPRLVPPEGFVHVDLDAGVFGRAYPQAPTLGVQADVGAVLDALQARSDRLVRRELPRRRMAAPLELVRATASRIHPAALMAAIQRVIVEGSGAPIFADASSAMFWGARQLVFDEPGRWFVEGRFGSMGSAGAAVVGAASGRGGPAAAICGDGSMHMQDEVNTAVHYGIPAIWIVLNDAGLGIVRAGMRATGRTLHDADYPPTDFAAVARAKGAGAVAVSHEADLDAALSAALRADGPFLVDVAIDQAAAPPIGARTKR